MKPYGAGDPLLPKRERGVLIDCDSLCAKEIALFHGCTLVMRCFAEMACSTVRKLTNANRLQRCDTAQSGRGRGSDGINRVEKEEEKERSYSCDKERSAVSKFKMKQTFNL